MFCKTENMATKGLENLVAIVKIKKMVSERSPMYKVNTSDPLQYMGHIW